MITVRAFFAERATSGTGSKREKIQLAKTLLTSGANNFFTPAPKTMKQLLEASLTFLSVSNVNFTYD